ncbi:MAG: glycosyltransferase family 1 protein [Acidobacteria bacterium]|nr:MAG: glycosyltransferase family 1 protein [Acidobacteriota bacterium]PYQ23946.1 MAG: glycosyltransferase family 1 protein [Acidobacteriota bacterium]
MPVAVLHVCDKFGVAGSSIHGVSRLFSWWFPRYDPRRFTVSLCGLKRPEPASRLLEEKGIPVRHLGRGRFDPRILGDLVRLARERRAAILHVHGYAAADFGRLAARRAGAALVLHEHFADPRMPGYQGLADRLLAPLTDRAIAVSGSTRDFLVRRRHVPEGKVRLIWNGAPLAEFAAVAPPVARAVRRELGLPADAPVVGSIGRLSEQKGHRYLLDAAARVLHQRTDARFLIAGDGDQMDPLRRQAEELGIASSVVFAGHRPDVPALLGAIDVFAISSTYEGTPLALFEAMAAGKAIVSTAVDGCREVLEDGLTGLLVPPRDPEALAAALRRSLDDEALRASLAARAREASARYDISACVARMQDLYDEVLAEKRRA